MTNKSFDKRIGNATARLVQNIRAVFDETLNDICVRAVRDANSKPFDPDRYKVCWPKRDF